MVAPWPTLAGHLSMLSEEGASCRTCVLLALWAMLCVAAPGHRRPAFRTGLRRVTDKAAQSSRGAIVSGMQQRQCAFETVCSCCPPRSPMLAPRAGRRTAGW